MLSPSAPPVQPMSQLFEIFCLRAPLSELVDKAKASFAYWLVLDKKIFPDLFIEWSSNYFRIQYMFVLTDQCHITQFVSSSQIAKVLLLDQLIQVQKELQGLLQCCHRCDHSLGTIQIYYHTKSGALSLKNGCVNAVFVKCANLSRREEE